MLSKFVKKLQNALVVCLVLTYLTGCGAAWEKNGNMDATGNLEMTADETDGGNCGAAEFADSVAGIESTMRETFIDKNPADGYDGEFVLIYNVSQTEQSIGTIEGLIETGAKSFAREKEIKTSADAGVYLHGDSCITEEIRTDEACYCVDSDIEWQVGSKHVFYLAEKQTKTSEILFKVVAEGEYCRVWTPVNPDFLPLEGIDASYPERLAAEVDAFSPVLDEYFGEIPDLRGDGKANILCYYINFAGYCGFTDYRDLLEEFQASRGTQMQKGNALPIVHINTAALTQGVINDFETFASITMHELQHLRTYHRSFSEGVLDRYFVEGDSGSGFYAEAYTAGWLGELLSAAAQEMYCYGSTYRDIPHWYYECSAMTDLIQGEEGFYLKRADAKMQNGSSLVEFNDTAGYSLCVFLAHFIENRYGTEAFSEILDAWIAEGCKGQPIEVIGEVLGYEDTQPFFEDLLLSILLHDSAFVEGKYRLEPFAADNSFCHEEDSGADMIENPFSLLVPIVTEESLSLQQYGYTVIRLKDKVYYPPEDAGTELRYVGFTIGE